MTENEPVAKMTEEDQIAASVAEIEKEVHNAIKRATANKDASTAQAMAVADQMIHRASAALADVHSHAMARITSMRDQLDELERAIIEARERSEHHMQRFMQLVTDGEESVRSMEKAVARIGEHVISR
jgi:TolA-binding protein